MYASDSSVGAVGEAFGNHALWTPQLLAGPPGLADSTRALATLTVSAEVLDLDDPAVLLERGLRPSEVVIRDLTRTQAWALRMFGERRWGGVRWWSRHDARWSAAGIWDRDGIDVENVAGLTLDHPAVIEAAEVLSRPWQ